MNSAIYRGHVRHRRFTPVDHQFSYDLFMLLIDLDELPLLKEVGINEGKFSAASFCTADYLGGGEIKMRAQARIAALTGEQLTGRVMLLTQLRYFGCSFNPVNFYYLYDDQDRLRWMLAEVRNTPGMSATPMPLSRRAARPLKNRFTFHRLIHWIWFITGGCQHRVNLFQYISRTTGRVKFLTPRCIFVISR